MGTNVVINIYCQVQEGEAIGRIIDNIMNSLDDPGGKVCMSAENIGWEDPDIDPDYVDTDEIEWGYCPETDVNYVGEEGQEPEKTEIEKALEDLRIAQQLINGDVAPEFALIYNNLLMDVIKRATSRLEKVVEESNIDIRNENW